MQEHKYEEEATGTGRAQTPTRPPRRNWCLIGGLVGLLAVILGGYFLTQQAGGGGAGFDAASYVLQIAKAAYQERARHAATGHDFGGGLVVVEYTDGSNPSVYDTPKIPIYEGQDAPPPDVNKTHSERRTWEEFVVPTLTFLKAHGVVAKASAIHVLIFSQFYPCPECRADMRPWQQEARQLTGLASTDISIWTLVKQFSPLSPDKKQRAQPEIHDEGDIEEVPINFVSLVTGQAETCDKSPVFAR